MPRSKSRDSYNSPQIAVRLTEDMYDNVIKATDEYGSAAQVVRIAVRDFFLRRDGSASTETVVKSTHDEVPA